jgi:hypothetical protein
MLIEGCGSDWSIQHEYRSTGQGVVAPSRHGDDLSSDVTGDSE